MEKAVAAFNHEASSPEVMSADPISVLNKLHKEVPIVRWAIGVARIAIGGITTVLCSIHWHVHGRGGNPDCDLHSPLHPLHPARGDRRGFRHWFRALDVGDRVRPERRQEPDLGSRPHLYGHTALLDADCLRLRRLDPASVAALGPENINYRMAELAVVNGMGCR
jgi:hypothetical protein